LAGINKLFAVKAAITVGICDTIARAGPGVFLSIHEIAKAQLKPFISKISGA
jgi:hypothetical protein